MQLDKIIKQAMLDNDISGVMELEKMSLVSYSDITKMMKGDGSVRLVKVKKLMDYLNIQIKFTPLKVTGIV